MPALAPDQWVMAGLIVVHFTGLTAVLVRAFRRDMRAINVR